MTMKTALSLIAAAVALVAGQAYAQTDRAAVKAEAAAANKKGELKPGEAGAAAPKTDAKMSDKKRADVKAEAAASEKKGEQKAGEASPGGAASAAKSTKARADVKAETKAAVKKGETPKPGEATPK